MWINQGVGDKQIDKQTAKTKAVLIIPFAQKQVTKAG